MVEERRRQPSLAEKGPGLQASCAAMLLPQLMTRGQQTKRGGGRTSSRRPRFGMMADFKSEWWRDQIGIPGRIALEFANVLDATARIDSPKTRECRPNCQPVSNAIPLLWIILVVATTA